MKEGNDVALRSSIKDDDADVGEGSADVREGSTECSVVTYESSFIIIDH